MKAPYQITEWVFRNFVRSGEGYCVLVKVSITYRV